MLCTRQCSAMLLSVFVLCQWHLPGNAEMPVRSVTSGNCILLPCIDLLLLSSSSGDVRTFAWSNLLINSSKQRVDRWRIGWLDGRSDSGISLSVCLLFASKDLVNGADETMTDVTAGGAGGEFGIEPV